MKRVVWDRDAVADLDQLWLHIARNDVDAADRFIDRIGARCSQLQRMERLGRARAEVAPDLRSILVGRYTVFYRIRANEVQIARIIHQSRDLDSLF